MFSELPKLFGRTFAIGFFLPATIVIAGTAFLLNGFIPYGLSLDQVLLPEVSLGLFAIWTLAILLMVLNRALVRLFEGYGKMNPFRLFFLERHKSKFRNEIVPLLAKAKSIEDARAANQPDPPTATDFSKKLSDAVSTYPDQERWVLPTAFGNIMRASEVYSRVLYGLDAIPAWPRLMMVLPKEAREQIQDSRAVLDFSVNICAAMASMIATYSVLAIVLWKFPNWWILPITSCLLALSWALLQSSALQWGEEIRSAFDLYRGLLADNLNLRTPDNSVDEAKMWQAVSRTMMFRSHNAPKGLDVFRDRNIHH